MSLISQISNWLLAAYYQAPNSLTESFYYDKTKNIFFSVLFTDYFMLNEKLELAEGVETSYSNIELNSLVSYMQRIDRKDSDLLVIPRLSAEKRKIIFNEFIETISDVHEVEKLLKQSEEGIRSPFHKSFEIESSEENINVWEDMKLQIAQREISSFLKSYSIDISKCSIFEFSEVSGTITIEVDKPKVKKTESSQVSQPKKKKWWKMRD